MAAKQATGSKGLRLCLMREIWTNSQHTFYFYLFIYS